MANLYVRSTDGSDADNGTTWALAKATLKGAAAIDSAGDTIYVSQDHAESTASAVTIALAGTLASPTILICGNDAAEPSTALATTATVSTTGASNLTITGVAYVYGITFSCGTTSSATSLVLAKNDGNYQIHSDCNFIVTSTFTSSNISVGSNEVGFESSVVWNNCGVKFANASQTIKPLHCRFVWSGGSLLSGGTTPTILITSQNDQLDVLVEGVDLSNGSAAMNLFSPGASSAGKAIFRNCKLPASWTGNIGTPTAFNTRIEMYNCDSADTNYRLWVEDYSGSIKSETTIIRTGGASDGTTGLSWKMASGANAEYPLIVLSSPEIVVWNDTTGSSKTVTVEVVTDNVTLTDAECWIEVQYLGTSGFPRGEFISDAKADVLATAANQTTSSETWTTTGLTTPVKQKLSVTFTPQEKGFFHVVVKLAKASTTVYVCPKATVT